MNYEPLLSDDYSEAAIAMAKAGRDGMLAKADELGLDNMDKVHEFIMATMKLYARTLGAAYVSAGNRDEVDALMATLTLATEQRVQAEIAMIQAEERRGN